MKKSSQVAGAWLEKEQCKRKGSLPLFRRRLRVSHTHMLAECGFITVSTPVHQVTDVRQRSEMRFDRLIGKSYDHKREEEARTRSSWRWRRQWPREAC
jgi:hypothetical protein